MSAKYWTVTRPMSLVSCDIKVEHWASSSAIAFWISARLAEANGVGNAMDISCSTGAIHMPNAARPPGSWGRSIRNRKSDVWGKSVTDRVNLGGRRNIKKKNTRLNTRRQSYLEEG